MDFRNHVERMTHTNQICSAQLMSVFTARSCYCLRSYITVVVQTAHTRTSP